MPGGFRVPRGFCPELDSCPGFSPGLDFYPGFVPEVRFLPGVESVGVSSTRGLGNSKLNFGNTILTQNTCISEKKRLRRAGHGASNPLFFRLRRADSFQIVFHPLHYEICRQVQLTPNKGPRHNYYESVSDRLEGFGRKNVHEN